MFSSAISTTELGVMMSRAVMSSSLSRCWIMLFSFFSKTPSSAPTVTMAETSSRLTESGCFLVEMMFVISSESTTKG